MTASTTTSIDTTTATTTESFLDRQLRLCRESHPSFKYGWMLEDRDRRNIQRIQYDGVYRDVVRHLLSEYKHNNCRTVEPGSDLNRLGLQIVHSVLAECLVLAESWKTIPARYVFKDEAKAETGLPVDLGVASRLATILADEAKILSPVEREWRVCVTFCQELTGGTCVYVAIESDGSIEVKLAEIEITRRVPVDGRWSLAARSLYGAIEIGALPNGERTGLIAPNGYGRIELEIADVVDQPLTGWISYN